ncbi:Maf family protein [Pelotomaculum propionicicum]|uniref:dTTP/UTP pyrophosphatase n=1 Tax=Pelotomaculum propionicicum TaxID=258475 RepID=A0A4Y7RVK3_9FIRM|nr:Maf family protein [Pelotomaculum propionicicum]NLI14599.1 septum formation inhibitor Maf [Peptococcaceae bacterium]TEB12746.1 Septum formation protein Maf [Pelotomaculum propionicicum]
MNREIILASSSPRRVELLKQIGLPFRVFCCEVDETPPPGLNPGQLVELLAERKAAGIAGKVDRGIVLGADTVVVCQGQLLGKPLDAEDAARMLGKLQGGAHEVYTGVALVEAESGRRSVTHEKTVVYFRPLGENEIRRYAATGEPLDKAGAYAVQGLAAVFIHRLEGCYTNVVGLPLARLAVMLKEFGYEVL